MPNFSQMFSPQLPPILNGAMAGASIPFGLQGAAQDLQGQDVDNQQKMENLRMLIESTNPALTAKNSLNQATDTAMNNPDNIGAAVGANLSKSLMSQMKDEEEKQLMQQNFIYKMGKEAEERAKTGGSMDPNDPGYQSWYSDNAEKAKQFGLNLKPGGDPQVVSNIINKSNALIQDPKFVQKMQELDATNKANKEIHAGNNAAMVKAAEIRGDASVYGADKRYDAAVQSIQGRMQMSQAPLQALVANIQSGKETDPVIIRYVATEAVRQDIAKTPMGMELLMKVNVDGTVTREFNKMVDDKVQQLTSKNVTPNTEGGVLKKEGTPPAAIPTTRDPENATFKAMKAANPKRTDDEIWTKMGVSK